ncbi:MAG: non-canonical purine NTP pyrophosphatase [Phycisphaerae bacterium]
MARSIVVATGNPGKLREIRQVLADLNVFILGLKDLPPVEEPEETGDTFGENARDKATWYALHTGKWCLADDSGLVVDALSEVYGIPEDELRPPPEFGSIIRTDFIRGLAPMDEKMIIVLDVDRLLGEEELDTEEA